MDTTSLPASSPPSFSVSALDEAVTYVLHHNFDAVSKACFVTVLKLLDNVLQKPDNLKVRTLSLNNTVVRQTVVNCVGGVELLRACGFSAPDETAASSTTPLQRLVLLREHENKTLLVTARRLLQTRCLTELGCTLDELPKYKPPPPAALPSAKTTTASAVPFNVYQGQRFDVTSAAVGENLGAPARYQSKTQVELERLQKQREALELQQQQQLFSNQQQSYNPREWTLTTPSTTTTNRTTNATAAATGAFHAVVNAVSGSATSGGGGSSSGGDMSLLAARAQKLHDERMQREQGGFTTMAMRSLERLQRQKVYSHVTVCLQFPDGCKLYGKFLPCETIQTVKDSVTRDCLFTAELTTIAQQQQQQPFPNDFDLYVTPPRRLLNVQHSLEKEGLVPAAKIFVSWKTTPPTPPFSYWKAELLATLPQLSSSSSSILFPTSIAVTAAIVDDSNDKDKKPKAKTDKAKSKTKASSREDDLLRRMMGR